MKNISIKLLGVWICVGLFFPKEINAQWVKIFGGTGHDEAFSVQQTSDGGYIIAGYTYSFGAGAEDVLLIKTDASGSVQWAKTIGGADSERAYSVQQTNDGGYIIAGKTSSFGASSGDVLLIKTDASGNVQWAKTIGSGFFDYATSVKQTSDGGYIAVGTFNIGGGPHALLIKTDASGNVQWTKNFGHGYATSFQQTNDGGYIIAGWTNYFGLGSSDVFLIKTDTSGNVKWVKTLGTNYSNEYAHSVKQTSDGGYIIAGRIGGDLLLIKTDTIGNVQWAKTIGGSGNNDYATSLQQTTDGGYILTGTTNSFGFGSDDVFLIKIDANGNIQWAKTIGGTRSDWGNFVQQTNDGGYIIAGGTWFGSGSNYNVFLIKTDDIGNTCPVSTANPTVTDISLSITSPTPTTISPPVSANVNPVETSPSVTESGICLSVGENSSFFPKIEHFSFKNNKISLKFSGYKEGEIKIVIYDISGKEKFSKSLNLKPYIEIEDKKIEKLKSGIYFLKVYLDNREIGGFKLIKK
jgi:hypothetical protein